MSSTNQSALYSDLLGRTIGTFEGIRTTRTIERVALGEFDDAIRYAIRVPPLNGFYDLICHGSRDGRHATPIVEGRDQWLDAQQLARIIQAQPDYRGQPVRMLTCWAGLYEDGLARQLSITLNQLVLAPTRKLWVSIEGAMWLADDSRWRCFTQRHVEDVDPQSWF